MSHRFSRRQCLRLASQTGAALAVPYFVPGRASGASNAAPPSERITMGVIGAGLRGTQNLGYFSNMKDVQVLAVCDVRKSAAAKAKQAVDARYGNTSCAAYQDFREIIARPDIDTVLVITPDHWHAIPSIQAMRAGKDVFCEKPLTLTIAEGREMVKVARRYGRVLSCGANIYACKIEAELIAEGMIGRVKECYFAMGGPPKPGNLPAEPVPDGLDYDLWLGQAPWAPYNALRVAPGGWRQIEDYAGGGVTDGTAHAMGSALYALGLDFTGPTEIIPPSKTDKNVKFALRFAEGPELRFEKHPDVSAGIVFVGTDGILPRTPTPKPKGPSRLRDRGRGIPGDFIHCVKTRALPVQDVESAHRVASALHLINIALKLRRPLRWDPVREQFIDDTEADRLRSRAMREPWTL